MKICFIGLGSIGKRHIKNLILVLNQRHINFTIDALRSSEKVLEEDIQKLISKTYYSFDAMPDDYDIIFITNPTSYHYETLKLAIEKGKHIFIEKPLYDKIYDAELLDVNDQDKIRYVACPLRYHPVIKYLKEYVNQHKIYSVRSICSSYLPDWRKNIDYRKNYSAIKEQGGGVSLDLIHEWDYLMYLFGKPREVFNIKGKYSDLEITSDDISIYIARYEDKLVELHLDYFGREDSRNVVLYTEDEVVTADLLKNRISISGNERDDIEFIEEDIYINEMNYFIDLIEIHRINENTVSEAYETLKIALNER